MNEYTLDLFKQLIDEKPVGVSAEIITEGEEKYRQLKSGESSVEEIEREMINFGKKIWPYLQAEVNFFEKYGKPKMNEIFLEKLTPELRAKWIEFESNGGDLHNFREGEEYEEAFSAEEDLQITTATVDSKKQAMEYVRTVEVPAKQEEYDKLVASYEKEREDILAKIAELRSLMDKGDRWDQEIENMVFYYEKGFAELEERPTVEKVQGKIDWYTGQMEAGNE